MPGVVGKQRQGRFLLNKEDDRNRVGVGAASLMEGRDPDGVLRISNVCCPAVVVRKGILRSDGRAAARVVLGIRVFPPRFVERVPSGGNASPREPRAVR
jgi:hypothetical protein